MSFELLYTSAPKGLKQGSRGFTTVVCTEGMPANLISRLEALSGYRHVFTPQDARYNDNPVAYSHLRVTSSGRARSILSRTCSYGVDYSGRTNKLAHHLALDSSEQIAAGPAWPLLNGEALRTSWDGQLATPASGPRVRPADQTQAVCQTWQNLTGDAGWGGALAEHFAAPQARPRWILYSIDQQNALLGLINEAIALLPTALRWQATFSTYATNLPPDVDCRLRCVLIDSPDARSVPVQSLLIDLTRPPALSVVSPWIDLARTGRKTVVQESAAATVIESSVPTLSSPPAPILDDDAPYRMQPPAILPNAKPASRHGTPAKSGPPAVGPPPQPKVRTHQYVLPATIAAVALLALGFGIYILSHRDENRLAASDAAEAKTRALDIEATMSQPVENNDQYTNDSRPEATPMQALQDHMAASIDTPEPQPATESSDAPQEVNQNAVSNTPPEEFTDLPDQDLIEPDLTESEPPIPQAPDGRFVIPISVNVSIASSGNITCRFSGNERFKVVVDEELNDASYTLAVDNSKHSRTSVATAPVLIKNNKANDNATQLKATIAAANDSKTISFTIAYDTSSEVDLNKYEKRFSEISRLSKSLHDITKHQLKKMNDFPAWRYHGQAKELTDKESEEYKHFKKNVDEGPGLFSNFNKIRRETWAIGVSSNHTCNDFLKECDDLLDEIKKFIENEEDIPLAYRRGFMRYEPAPPEDHLSIATTFKTMLNELIELLIRHNESEPQSFGTVRVYTKLDDSALAGVKEVLEMPIEVTLKITHIQIGGL